MATIATATVQIDANTVKFVNDLKRAEKKSRQFGKNASQSFGKIGRSFKNLGVGVAAASTAFAAFLKVSLDASDQFVKTSQKLGLTTKALSGLRFAAEKSGVPVNQLDMGIQRMTRRVAEAAQGTGEAQGALKELGLDAEKLNRLPLEEQFRAVSEAMTKVEGESDKVRLSFKLFDSEGVALKNTLALGADALKDAEEQAAALGLSLDKIQIKNIEEAKESITVMEGAFSGLSRQLSATFAPAMEAGAEKIAEFITRVTDSLPDLAAWASAVFHMRREVNDLTNQEISTEMEKISSTIEAYQKRLMGLSNLSQVVSPGSEEFDRAQTDIRKLQEEIGNLGARYVELRLEKDKLSLEPPELEEGGVNGVTETDEGPAGPSLEQIRASEEAATQVKLEAIRRRKEAEQQLEQEFYQAAKENRIISNAEMLELARQSAEALVTAKFEAEAAAREALGIPLTPEEEIENKVSQLQMLHQAMMSEYQRFYGMKLSQEEKAKKQSEKLDQQAAQTRLATMDVMLGGAKMFFGKSKVLSKAAAAFEQREQIRKAWNSTKTGMTKALEWGWPMGPVFAAAIGALGAANIASMIGVGGGGGGGGGSVGSVGGAGSIGSVPTTTDDEPEEKEKARSSVQVIFQGDVIGWDEHIETRVIDGIREASKDKDVIVIDSDSRNAQEILAAAT